MMDYRLQRRAYRRWMRGPSGGLGGLIWLIAIASLAMTHLWQLAILVFIGLPFFFLVLRPILFSAANAGNQQSSQPQQEQPLYQPYRQEQPYFQPYTRGYGEQQYQYPAQQTQQYEEPITMYPQE